MFELGKFFSGISKPSKKNSSRNLLADPIKASILLAVVVVLIIYFIFRDVVDEEESFFGIMFKAGLFVLISVFTVVFLHSKNMEHVYEEKYADSGAKEITARSTEPTPEDVGPADLKKTEPSPEPVPEKVEGQGESSTPPSTSNSVVNITVNGPDKHSNETAI
jgi:hypothetical protein